METTTLTINLPKNISLALEVEAIISGKNVAEYVEELLSKQVKYLNFEKVKNAIDANQKKTN